jgi:hypothetical protein
MKILLYAGLLLVSIGACSAFLLAGWVLEKLVIK